MNAPHRTRARHWAIVATALALVLLLAATASCAPQAPPSPPRGATGKVVDRELVTRHETRTVPRTTQACKTTNGRRTCRTITTGTKQERRTVVQCRRITLDTGHTYCVSAALYQHTRTGDHW